MWTGWATPEEADQAVASLVARDALDEPQVQDRAETIRDLLELYQGRQQARQDLSEATVHASLGAGRRLARGIGEVRTDRLDVTVLERYRDQQARGGVAGATIALDLRVLRAGWAWARQVGLVPDRSLPQIRVLQTPIPRHVPTREQLVAVVGALRGWTRIAILLIAATGCRRGEACALTWQSLDLEAGELVFPQGKTGARPVPLAPPIVVELRALRAMQSMLPGEDDRRIWPVSETTFHTSLGRSLAQACAAVGVPRVVPKALRRAAVDALYRSGADVAAAASMLGHSPEVALRHYREVTQDDRRRAMELARLGYLEPGSVVELQGRRRGPR